MNGFSHHFLTYLIFTKIWCYVISFSSLYDIYLSLSHCGTLPVRYLALCSLFSILSMRYVCAVFGWTLPVTYIHWLCCFFSIFSVRYRCLVFSCGTLPWRYLSFCCFFSIFSVRYHCVPFGCGTLPVRHLALCCLFSIFSMRYLCLVFGCKTLHVVLMWLCAVYFRSSLCDIFIWYSAVEVCLWDGRWHCIFSFGSPWTNNG